jgi:hypothetical protein
MSIRIRTILSTIISTTRVALGDDTSSEPNTRSCHRLHVTLIESIEINIIVIVIVIIVVVRSPLLLVQEFELRSSTMVVLLSLPCRNGTGVALLQPDLK